MSTSNVEAIRRFGTKPRIAFVAGTMPAYDAGEHTVVEYSKSQLAELASKMDFELVSIDTDVGNRAAANSVAHDLLTRDIDLVLLQHSSFITGDIALEFAECGLRLGLWATQEPVHSGPIPLNNFVALNLSAGVLKRWLSQKSVPFKWFYGKADDPHFVSRLDTTVRALRVVRQLRSATIGWVGGIAPTFMNIAFDERVLREQTGAQTDYRELAELFARTRSQPSSRVRPVVKQLYEAPTRSVEVSAEHMDTEARVYLAMLDMAQEYHWDALAVRDWPEFQSELSIHPGLAFSWLDEHEQISVASEGDVLGAVSQLAANAATGAQSLLLDMNDVDFENESVLMWHCGGSPLWFADDDGFSWENHSTIGRHDDNIGALGAIGVLKFRPGPATVLRIGDGGRELFAANADIVAGGSSGFHGSRGWFSNFEMESCPVSIMDLMNTIFTEGVEHHFIVGAGRRAEALYEMAYWLGMRVLEPIAYRSYMRVGG